MKTCPRGCARRNVWRQWIVTFAAIVALFQSAVGRTDQESPPRAPAVNDPHPWNYEIKDWSFEVTNRSQVPSAFEIKDWSFEVTNRSHVPSAFEIKDWSFEVFFLSRGGKLEPLFGAPRVNEATGELFVEYLDLVIPGRGLDLVWGRTYRSKIGMDTAMGVGWDFSYNIRAALSGRNITVQDGQNRIDTYFLQADGSFSSDEFFRRGTLSEKVFTLEFADKTSWIFKPLNGSPTSGKIDKIIDRNSNQIQFQYDGAGRLFLIIDSLNRPFQISYDGANRIQAVQDFTGRTIQYQHLNAPTPGIGDVGDLVLVRSQAVTGTPIGNDFPSGKTAQFTYSTGLGGARDHNLLTARDGNNVQWFQAVYTTTAVTTNFLYDRVASEIVGTAGETKVFTYLAKLSPNSRFSTATKTIVNDAVGNVHESLFDSKNRLIDLRQFTGRSTPGVPVTESANRPINPVRPTDPAFFQTTIDWNRDSLPTRVTLPRGNGVEMVYQRDFDLATNPRERANLRVHRQLPIARHPAGRIGSSMQPASARAKRAGTRSGDCFNCVIEFQPKARSGDVLPVSIDMRRSGRGPGRVQRLPARFGAMHRTGHYYLYVQIRNEVTPEMSAILPRRNTKFPIAERSIQAATRPDGGATVESSTSASRTCAQPVTCPCFSLRL